MERLLKYHKDGKMEEVDYLYAVLDPWNNDRLVTILVNEDRAKSLCHAFGFYYNRFYTDATNSYGKFTAFSRYVDAGYRRFSLTHKVGYGKMSVMVVGSVSNDIDICTPHYFVGQVWARTVDEAREKGMKMWEAGLASGHVPDGFFEDEENDDSIHIDE